MKIKQIISLSVLLLVTAVAMSSCDNSIHTDLEESLAPYLELGAIEEASNTTLTIRKGESAGLDSYFAFDVSNIKSNSIIKEGLVEGWCLEWDKPIASNNDRHDGVEAYSTYGSTTWKPVNYLMSIKNQLKKDDPSLTYREIQVALWSLIEVPRFNLDEVLANGRMPSRLMSDGEPNFSVEKVKSIVDRVRSNADSYTYSENTPFMVFARTDDDSQNGGFVTCESGDADLCEGFVSVSGFVFVDANSNQVKNSNESGIQNTTVTLTDGEGMEAQTRTGQDGFYSFIVFTGDEEKTFTLEVSEVTDDADDFNEGLFDSYLPTTPISGVSVTAASDNVAGVNFGFEPKVEELIERFNDGSIVTNTEERKFWIKQLLLGAVSEFTGITIDTEVPKDLLISHLNDIEGLLLEEPFQFGENKLKSALLTILKQRTAIDRLLAELLTAELNVVSGRGSGSVDFDLALIAFGESAAVELMGGGEELRAAMKTEPTSADVLPEFDSVKTAEDARALLRETLNSVASETESMPITSSATTDDAEPLLRSFNRSGGGGGSVGPR